MVLLCMYKPPQQRGDTTLPAGAGPSAQQLFDRWLAATEATLWTPKQLKPGMLSPASKTPLTPAPDALDLEHPQSVEGGKRPPLPASFHMQSPSPPRQGSQASSCSSPGSCATEGGQTCSATEPSFAPSCTPCAPTPSAHGMALESPYSAMAVSNIIASLSMLKVNALGSTQVRRGGGGACNPEPWGFACTWAHCLWCCHAHYCGLQVPHQPDQPETPLVIGMPHNANNHDAMACTPGYLAPQQLHFEAQQPLGASGHEWGCSDGVPSHVAGTPMQVTPGWRSPGHQDIIGLLHSPEQQCLDCEA